MTIRLPLGEAGVAVLTPEDWFVGARDIFYGPVPKAVVQSFPVDEDFYDDMLSAATTAASETVIPFGYTLAVNGDGNLVPAVPDDSLPFVGVAAAPILNDASNAFDIEGDPVIGDGALKLPVITSGYFDVAGMTFPNTFTNAAAKLAVASYRLYPGCNILVGRKLYDDVITNQPIDSDAGGPWLLLGGVWNDDGVWDDDATWDDGAGGGGGGDEPFDFSTLITAPSGLSWQSEWLSPTTIEFTNLISANGIFFSGKGFLTSLSFPALTDIPSPGVEMLNMSGLTTLLFTALVNVDELIFPFGMGALTSFSVGTGLKSVGGDVNFTAGALDVTSVNNLLIALAALDGTNGTTLYTGHTVTIGGTSAAPTGAGATAKAALISAGNSVSTN